jgi:protocatechuate 3,4-dioxygenase alpha subunit
MTQQAITRIYFEDQDATNAVDPILALVPADRRAILIARCGQGDVTIYRFDIYLQGVSETV